MAQKDSAEKAVRDIRRKTRRKFSAEEKIRIVLEGRLWRGLGFDLVSLRGNGEEQQGGERREGVVENDDLHFSH